MKQRQAFTYDNEQHADIHRWLNAQANRSAAIRAAIRADIYRRRLADELRPMIREELARVSVVGSGGDGGQDADPEMGRLLDEMF